MTLPGSALSQRRCLVFDSGIGGMGVVQALQALQSGLEIDYLADTALFPYGEQPDDILTKRVVTLLTAACKRLEPDIIVIACNTASTLALSAVRQALSVPVVGCVPPVRWAGRVSLTRTIGLLSTSATARRPYVQALHREFASDCHLVVHGARPLADLAERAFLGGFVDETLVRAELDALFNQPHGALIDTIGLGCTHYTFLLPALQRQAPAGITWLDPAPAVARQVRTILENEPLPVVRPRQPALKKSQLFLTKELEVDHALFQEAIVCLGFLGCTVFAEETLSQETAPTTSPSKWPL